MLEPTVNRINRLFRYGDRLARTLIVIIAIGGTALAIDVFYPISFLNWFEWLDTLVKRLAPILVSIAIIAYVSSLVSKFVFRAAAIDIDRSTLRYELLYYIWVIVLAAAIAILLIGAPIESFLPHASNGQNVTPGPSTNWAWDGPTALALLVVLLIALVWTTAMFLCVFSRKAEWVLRDRVLAATAVAPPKATSEPPLPDNLDD